MAASLQSAVAFLVRTGETAPSRPEDEVAGFYDEFRAPLLRYLGSLRIAAEDAEEIVQEVFLALFRHLRDGKSRANLRGWIFRVAHNLAMRNRIARLRYPEAGAGLEPSDPGLNPEQLAAGKQRRARLLAVVEALSEQDQHCLALRAEGFRYREIGKIVGISLGSVANALARSVARLSRADGER